MHQNTIMTFEIKTEQELLTIFGGKLKCQKYKNHYKIISIKISSSRMDEL